MKIFKQETYYSCGASAVRNILNLYFKLRISEKRLRKLCNTDKNGTDKIGIMNTLANYGVETREFYNVNSEIFKENLINELKTGNNIICLVDNTTHWIVISGYYNKKFNIIDSDIPKGYKQLTTNAIIKLCNNFDKIAEKNYYYFISCKKTFY